MQSSRPTAKVAEYENVVVVVFGPPPLPPPLVSFPVSYTHLAVYKRQEDRQLLRAERQQEGPLNRQRSGELQNLVPLLVGRQG